jgi:cytochrome oxidase Cu insertion factor (SCO1/SenC/PrrC family)
MRLSYRCFAVLLLAICGLVANPLAGQRPERKDGDLKVGDAAPDFAVQDVTGKKTVKLSELRGKPVVLIFGSCT